MFMFACLNTKSFHLVSRSHFPSDYLCHHHPQLVPEATLTHTGHSAKANLITDTFNSHSFASINVRTIISGNKAKAAVSRDGRKAGLKARLLQSQL